MWQQCKTRWLVSLAIVFGLANVALADDWPQWLGSQRDAIWRETGVVARFPEKGITPKWRMPVGLGYAGPAVASGRVYVTDRVLAKGAKNPSNQFSRDKVPGQERVLCLDAATGKEVWKHAYDCVYTISYAEGPRTTPVVHQGKLYTLGAEGNLICFDAAKGNVLWSKDLKTEYKVAAPTWGFSAHPLIDGQKLICIVGGPGSVAVAFDKDSGKELWKALSATEPGYCPPTIVTAGGTRQLIIWHGEAINSLDPETGKVHWSEPVKAAFGMSIATPRQVDDKLFISAFQGSAMLFQLDQSKPAASVLWKGQQKTAVYSTMSTPFVEAGYVYSNCSNGEFRCVELATGERKWETFAPTTGKRGANWGNAFIVKNGDRYFLASENGDLIIAKLSPTGYEEVSRMKLIEPTGSAGGRSLVWSHPAFANKCVYARNDKEIVCVSLAE